MTTLFYFVSNHLTKESNDLTFKIANSNLTHMTSRKAIPEDKAGE